MKVGLISDIHGRNFWRLSVHKMLLEGVDKIIFLGDYLDPYQKEIEENSKLMECNSFDDANNLLKMLEDIISLKKIEPNKYILLTGNHTDSYIWSKFHAATRTDYKNWELYHKFFSQNLEYFNLVWIENNCIFSHAGISQGWAKRVWEKLEYPVDGLISIMEIAVMLRDTPLTEFTNDYINIISDISYYRYGEAKFGSCEWADIREHINHVETLKLKQDNKITKIIPIGEEGIYQVFGHTQLKEPLITDKWACLDCRKGFIFDTITHDCISCL